jgi:hypothetical protein
MVMATLIVVHPRMVVDRLAEPRRWTLSLMERHGAAFAATR